VAISCKGQFGTRQWSRCRLRRSWLQDTLNSKLVDFAWNRRFFYLPGACSPSFGLTRLNVLINPIVFIRSACFDLSSGQPRVNPGKQEGGGGAKNQKNGEFSFRGILQPTTSQHARGLCSNSIANETQFRVRVIPTYTYMYMYMYIYIYAAALADGITATTWRITTSPAPPPLGIYEITAVEVRTICAPQSRPCSNLLP